MFSWYFCAWILTTRNLQALFSLMSRALKFEFSSSSPTYLSRRFICPVLESESDLRLRCVDNSRVAVRYSRMQDEHYFGMASMTLCGAIVRMILVIL